jgi:hypothetical protein
VTRAPKRLEIQFFPVERASMTRFIDNGVAPAVTPRTTTASPMLAPRDDELEFDIDDSDVGAEPVAWDLGDSELPVRTGSAAVASAVPAPPDDDDLDIIIDDGREPSGPHDLARFVAALAMAPAPLDSTAAPVERAAGATKTSSTLEGEAVFDVSAAAVDPGHRPRSIELRCASCTAAPYVIDVGPCAGLLGLFADLQPFWCASSRRVVTVPRAIPVTRRRERWQRYLDQGGGIDDVVTLSTLLATAALSDPPLHPITAEELRSTRAVERLLATAQRLSSTQPQAVTRVACAACADAHLVAVLVTTTSTSAISTNSTLAATRDRTSSPA